MTVSEAVKALKARKAREVRVGAKEASRCLAELSRHGIRATASPVRVGGLIVAREIRRID